MKKFATAIAAAAMLATATVATAAGPMKAGKWQLTMQMDMPGMPVKMPPMTMTHCITKEQAEKPEPPKAASDCKVSDYKIVGSTVTWTVKCEKQKIVGEGTITYNGDSYDGSMHMKMADREMTQKYSGKRLGNCDGSEK
jgi:hypothetical protein